MRESRSRRSPRPQVSQQERARQRRPGYVTLREASAETGIPVNTLRKWARRDAVESYLESDGELTLRMVSLVDVERRAIELGRETADDPSAAPATTEEVPPASATDTMIVPVDAWNKMLLQLGNLHEAGQQLAEARERAAKAETEAAFLKERLAELRGQSTAEPPNVADTPSVEDAPSVDDIATVQATIPRWRAVYRSWRRS